MFRGRVAALLLMDRDLREKSLMPSWPHFAFATKIRELREKGDLAHMIWLHGSYFSARRLDFWMIWAQEWLIIFRKYFFVKVVFNVYPAYMLHRFL